MECKICKFTCASCDPMVPHNYSVCTKCWSDHGFDIIEERWIEEREAIEAKWDKIIYEKIEQRAGV